MSFDQYQELKRSAPYFPVGDVEKAVNYYERTLGFKCEYKAGDPAMFAIVSRDDLAIMFRLVNDPDKIVPNEDQGGSWDVFFWVADAESLCDEFHAKGADVIYGPIVQESYNMKEFAVRDRNGYVLGFGQELS